MNKLNVLFIGDIVGKPGRKAVSELLEDLKEEFSIDFTIANVENAAGGAGITEKIIKELLDYGIDVMTSGNHIWDKREALKFIEHYPMVLRPVNFTHKNPGHGYGIFRTKDGTEILVINAIGRLFTGIYDSPYYAVDRVLEENKEIKIRILDFHAETTMEKQVAGYYFDGRVTAVLGTHTHVQTADEKILKGGTAYITDVGMTGGLDSAIGVKKELAIARVVDGLPVRYEPSNKLIGLEGVVLEIDKSTGKALGIKRLRRLTG